MNPIYMNPQIAPLADKVCAIQLDAERLPGAVTRPAPVHPYFAAQALSVGYTPSGGSAPAGRAV